VKKVLVVSAWAPPMGGGSPIALAKRLRGLPIGSYLLLTSERRFFVGKSATEWLPAPYYFLGETEPRSGPLSLPTTGPNQLHGRVFPIWVARLLLPLARPIRDLVQLLIRSPAVYRHIVSVIGKEQPDVVLATSDDGIFLVSAYRAARATKTPLDVLLLDIYARNNYSWVKRILARVYEPRILRAAARVFVTNTATRDYYRDLYGIRAEVLEHQAPPAMPAQARAPAVPSVITYTGSIYWAQLDAMQMLVQALERLPAVRLLVVSDLAERDLRRLGVWSTKVQAQRAHALEVPALQGAADLLYLPLTFQSAAPYVIKTAAPGKMAEYLVSGVPILVHAPAYSFIARDARQSAWGLVVDEPSITSLVRAVQTLLEDQALRQRLVAKAFAVAKERHDGTRISERFRQFYALIA
jgi:glycosyltransferase involved in cell wall biosynthesis